MSSPGTTARLGLECLLSPWLGPDSGIVAIHPRSFQKGAQSSRWMPQGAPSLPGPRGTETGRGAARVPEWLRSQASHLLPVNLGSPQHPRPPDPSVLRMSHCRPWATGVATTSRFQVQLTHCKPSRRTATLGALLATDTSAFRPFIASGQPQPCFQVEVLGTTFSPLSGLSFPSADHLSTCPQCPGRGCHCRQPRLTFCTSIQVSLNPRGWKTGRGPPGWPAVPSCSPSQLPEPPPGTGGRPRLTIHHILAVMS